MLDGIEVDVIQVPLIILFMLYQMFPEPALPDATLTPTGAIVGNIFAFLQSPREMVFYQSPAIGVIIITTGKCPYTMQVIRKHDKTINAKGISFQNFTESEL